MAVVAVSVLVMMRALPLTQLQEHLTGWIDRLGFWGPVAFSLIYIVATVCLFPASVLTLAAGATFGLLIGFIIVSISSTVGAVLAFLIARYVARGQVEKLAESNQRFNAIDSAISEGGWRIVALLRLSPAIPFNLQNYLYGLTDIGLLPYFFASWIAMIPGTFLYVYLGHIAGAAVDGQGDGSVGKWAMLVIGLLATAAVTFYITKLARKQLNTRTDIKQAGETSEEDQSPEKNAPPSEQVTYIPYMTAAAISVALAVIAHLQSNAIASFLGL